MQRPLGSREQGSVVTGGSESRKALERLTERGLSGSRGALPAGEPGWSASKCLLTLPCPPAEAWPLTKPPTRCPRHMACPQPLPFREPGKGGRFCSQPLRATGPWGHGAGGGNCGKGRVPGALTGSLWLLAPDKDFVPPLSSPWEQGRSGILPPDSRPEQGRSGGRGPGPWAPTRVFSVRVHGQP